MKFRVPGAYLGRGQFAKGFTYSPTEERTPPTPVRPFTKPDRKGRVFFFEVSGPFQRKLGRFDGTLMRRYWWLWFAWGYIKMPLDIYNARAGKWQY